jgi:hypothetical protein
MNAKGKELMAKRIAAAMKHALNVCPRSVGHWTSLLDIHHPDP